VRTVAAFPMLVVAVMIAVVLGGCTLPARTLDGPKTAPARSAAPSVQARLPATTVDPRVAMTWPVPDDTDTPGLVTPGCTYPRDDDERQVTASTKRAAAKRYNYTGPSSQVEYDHRVPFSLCGANTVANIWPEPEDGVDQSAFVANRKDQLEAFAARQVRYKRWTLAHAQAVFLGDWRVAWCQNLHYPGVVCPA